MPDGLVLVEAVPPGPPVDEVEPAEEADVEEGDVEVVGPAELPEDVLEDPSGELAEELAEEPPAAPGAPEDEGDDALLRLPVPLVDVEEVPDVGVLVDAVDDEPDGDALAEDPVPEAPAVDAADVVPGLEATFSAVRSMVTGRLEDPVAVLPVPDALSEGEDPALPADLPVDAVPSDDFLSVVISSPPEPERFQDVHYTRLFQKRYRMRKDFCAAQKNDSPGSG